MNKIDELVINFATEVSHTWIKDDPEPMDGDETERLGKIFLAQLDWVQGNITHHELEQKFFDLDVD